MTDLEHTEVPLKYNYGRIYVTSTADYSRLTEMARTGDYIADQLSRAHADIIFEILDMDNAHIGPQHRPGRRELYAARRAEMQHAYFRSLGRPRGPYRR